MKFGLLIPFVTEGNVDKKGVREVVPAMSFEGQPEASRENDKIGRE